jgi:Na+-transporting methylmalonyl-CoA/oxaloacetate decarboxylase gamma subunit
VDESIFSGPNLAFVGISTVFVALLLMVIAITLMRRILAPQTSETLEVAKDAAGANENGAAATSDENVEDTLRGVALAAYAFHCSRSVRVPSATGSSPWQRAGRVAQVERRKPRH